MDFVKADTDLSGHVSRNEAALAGWAADFDDYDYDGKEYWDFLDYLEYVRDNMYSEEGWT